MSTTAPSPPRRASIERAVYANARELGRTPPGTGDHHRLLVIRERLLTHLANLEG